MRLHRRLLFPLLLLVFWTSFAQPSHADESSVGQAQSGVIVLAGATGDLAKRKVIPAIFDLYGRGELGKDFQLIAVSRKGKASDAKAFFDKIEAGVKEVGHIDTSSESWGKFRERMTFAKVDFADKHDVRALHSLLKAGDPSSGPRKRLFYLSVPPSGIRQAVEGLASAKLIGKSSTGMHGRVVIEKPFGRNIKEAKELNQVVRKAATEGRVHRMDHYLGKDGVLGLSAMRFDDGALEGIWNRKYINQVRIRGNESIGIEGRGKFYEEAGALRDFMQGHLFQMFSVVAMERPSKRADGVRNAKVQFLRQLRQQSPRQIRKNTVRGQYTGYLQEPGVKPDSRTETYVAHRAFVDNKRWSGVPFVLETGKSLEKKEATVQVELRKLSPELAKHLGVHPNQSATLTLDVGAGSGVRASIQIAGKKKAVDLSPLLPSASAVKPRGAYSRLIGAAVKGDTSVFVRGDEAELTWSYLRPVQKEWKRSKKPLAQYKKGAARPWQANKLFRERVSHRLRRWSQRGRAASRTVLQAAASYKMRAKKSLKIRERLGALANHLPGKRKRSGTPAKKKLSLKKKVKVRAR